MNEWLLLRDGDAFSLWEKFLSGLLKNLPRVDCAREIMLSERMRKSEISNEQQQFDNYKREPEHTALRWRYYIFL